MRLSATAILAVVLLASVGSHAEQEPTFSAETRLVVLQATVEDNHGVLVPNLSRDAFAVYENGKRRPIALFLKDDAPVSIGLLIDNSGSMRPNRPAVEAAALDFARASNAMDEMFVVNFADKVRIDVPFTSDLGALERGVTRVDGIGGTALYDAVDIAAEVRGRSRIARSQGARGRDRWQRQRQCRDPRRRAEAGRGARYGHLCRGPFGDARTPANRGRRELDQLTDRTGGTARYPATVDEVGTAVTDLARQIRSQYTIAYTPQSTDVSYRSIRVTATAGGSHLVVRARPGYRPTS